MRPTIPLLPSSLRWAGVLAVAGLLVYFSLLDVPAAAPAEPGPFWDKRLHFAGYAALTLSLSYATVRSDLAPKRRALLVVGVAVAFGVAIELLQGPLPDRYFSYGDILANVLGSLVAAGWLLVERHVDYVPVPG